MRRRHGPGLMIIAGLSALISACFEVPPLPEAPACEVNSDCADGVFCNGEERCVSGECVFGIPCTSLCFERGDGTGSCESEPEPDPLPEPGPGVDPLPGVDPEPGPQPAPEPPPEPEPNECVTNNRPCFTGDGTPGTCFEGECLPELCEEALDCPSPGCATCTNGVCGQRAACASIGIRCDGDVGMRIQIDCGGESFAQECGFDDEAVFVGCPAAEPVDVCCGAVGESCAQVAPTPATVTLGFDPQTRWTCTTNDDTHAVCAHPGPVRRSETFALCVANLLDLPGGQ